ncbi:PLC-like phosphodiesterase [Gymnopilus junonius]|uniref:PLC-like phosphodiesterase n=1 Tax=Gymnopilus junonius TaxID=109634 RepID=A0A9P5P3N6_GYMJU|nr:PLC-like phosphodiesterase [Gymnopilus junonius]
MSTASTRALPECWGHRGASSRFPENTLASFEAAIRDGAEGIESDVHVSKDDVVIMFHDPVLERTTDSKGQIKERTWYGEDGMQHVRTVKEPKQSIPTFEETVALLMKPENLHAKFNVDVKVQNDPDRLFALMHKVIAAQPNWETTLAPRILLGLWHPRFIVYAKEPLVCKKVFWNDCHAFSMSFGSLTTMDGQRFRDECKVAGKNLMAVRWNVNAIITDFTKNLLMILSPFVADYEKIGSQYGRFFLWTTFKFYTPVMLAYSRLAQTYLESIAGPFDEPVAVSPTIKTEA